MLETSSGTRLSQGGGDHLVDELALEVVGVVQHPSPQILVLSLHQVARLVLEEAVLVGHGDQLGVAGAAGPLVGDEGQVGVAALAVGADHRGVVEAVLSQELLGVVVDVHVDLRQTVVDVGVLAAFLVAGLQEGSQQLEAVALLNLSHQLVHEHRVVGRGAQVV